MFSEYKKVFLATDKDYRPLMVRYENYSAPAGPEPIAIQLGLELSGSIKVELADGTFLKFVEIDFDRKKVRIE